METKKINVCGKRKTFLRYKDVWVHPMISWYEGRIGSPVAVLLFTKSRNGLEYYGDVTVNLPDCKRSRAGCQFINTNNMGEDILDWLEENGFGKRTGYFAQSGFFIYPEFDFYSGEKFWEYRQESH